MTVSITAPSLAQFPRKWGGSERRLFEEDDEWTHFFARSTAGLTLASSLPIISPVTFPPTFLAAVMAFAADGTSESPLVSRKTSVSAFARAEAAKARVAVRGRALRVAEENMASNVAK
ncbi:hypothetical protein OF846_003921 [Rhodotorula toruloides]|nr:hypothetical protein OF846_003921 [Rhodotorula toruloides]